MLVNRIGVINNKCLTDGTAIKLARIGGDHDDIETMYGDSTSAMDVDIISDEGGGQYVYHRLNPDESTIEHRLFSLLDEYCLMIVYPMRLDRETGLSVTLVGTTDRIQAAYVQFPAEMEYHIMIDQITRSMHVRGGLRSLLTERRRELLDAAIALGYYSRPRRVTSSDVAEAAGCAPSTSSEHLRKIESRILSSLEM